MPAINPRLTIQTASLYASGEASSFSGTGGPFGYSPFTSQFGGIISSAGLNTEPFADTVYDVSTKDELTFVIAVQNVQAAAAYGIRLRDIMPPGFAAPADGLGLSVTDGTGTDLTYTGDLFGTAGLTLSAPLAAYDANSGKNVALITFSLAANAALPGPYATLSATASIDAYTAAPGGPDLAAANPASASTTIVTAAPAPQVTPESDPTAVARGQTIAFDVTISVPAGSLQDFTLAPIATAGPVALDLVSTSIVSIGNALQTGTAYVSTDGVIHFGTVSYNGGAGSNAITARVVVRASGSTSGSATLQTVISAADPASPGGRWSANVASSVGVVVPPPPAVLAGLSAIQGIAPNATTHPFATFAITGQDLAQTGSIAITLQDLGTGRLGNPGTGSIDTAGATFFATGTLASLQAAARLLTYVPSAAGTAHFTITVIDAAGGIAQDSATTVTAQTPQPTPPPPPPPEADLLFDATYYLAHNADVAAAGVDPYQHYMIYGWHEGRNPNAMFNTNFYLTHNPDVAAAGVNPMRHFETNGWHEARDPSLLFSDAAYLAHNPDVARAGIDPLVHYTLYGKAEGRLAFMTGGTAPADGLIDPTFYANQVGAAFETTGLAAAQQAAWNYANGGWQLGLNPNSMFDTNYYLAHNPDVAAAHINPLQHYEEHGWREGRDPSATFSDAKYRAAYNDVRDAQMDPLRHYVLYGAAEGRSAFAV